MTIRPERLPEAQKQSWLGLLNVASRIPDNWCLVGGQMVYLLCQERGLAPARPTTDGDVVLDVRTQPRMLRRFTQALLDEGFQSVGVTPEGHQHRFVRDLAVIDVLIPQHLGNRATSRRGATGGTTLGSPGAQQAIDRSEPVSVDIDGTVGIIRRPNMIGALVAKAAAYSVPSDPAKDRHVTDFATLAAMARASDGISGRLRPRDLYYLDPMLWALDRLPQRWTTIDGAERGVLGLRSAIDHAREVLAGTTSPRPGGAPPIFEF